MNYLATTVPSDYDLNGFWGGMLGKAECEWAAQELIGYLQRDDDEWRPVPFTELHPRCRHVFNWAERNSAEEAEMPERWLNSLQRLRVPRPGPIELIYNPDARGSLQLRAPNGQVRAAAHDFSDEQMAKLRAAQGWVGR